MAQGIVTVSDIDVGVGSGANDKTLGGEDTSIWVFDTPELSTRVVWGADGKPRGPERLRIEEAAEVCAGDKLRSPPVHNTSVAEAVAWMTEPCVDDC
jgi:hypothetical protein